MAEKIYQVWNGPAPTTAAQVGVTTGTAMKVMLQVSTPSTAGIYITDWGYSFNGATAAAGPEVELIDSSVASTAGTATVAADIVKWSEPTGRASLVTLGTGNTGYTFGTQGATAGVRVLDAQYEQPTNYYYKQFPLGREPTIDVSRFVQIRVTAVAAVLMVCYIQWGE